MDKSFAFPGREDEKFPCPDDAKFSPNLGYRENILNVGDDRDIQQSQAVVKFVEHSTSDFFQRLDWLQAHFPGVGRKEVVQKLIERLRQGEGL